MLAAPELDCLLRPPAPEQWLVLETVGNEAPKIRQKLAGWQGRVRP